MVWAWVTVTGRPTHVREMHAGVNAIDAAYVIAERFRAYEAEMNRAEHRHPAFAADNHPINVNFGTIEGGEWNSSVPSRARIGLRVGVMPGHSCREVRAEIERLVADAAADPRLRGAQVSVAFRGLHGRRRDHARRAADLARGLGPAPRDRRRGAADTGPCRR